MVVPFAMAGAALPLVLGLIQLWDGPPPPTTHWTVGVPSGAVLGALGAVPVLAAVRAGRPVAAAVAGLAFPYVLLVGFVARAAFLGWLRGDALAPYEIVGAFTYFTLLAYVPCALVSGFLTWVAYAHR